MRSRIIYVRNVRIRNFKFVKRQNAIGDLIATSIFVLASSGTGSTNDHGPTEQWKEYAETAELWTFAGYYDDLLAGYYELRRDTDGEDEIAYFGLLPEFIGRGLGGALLTSAIEEAWSRRDGTYPVRVGCTRATVIIRRRSRTIRHAG